MADADPPPGWGQEPRGMRTPGGKLHRHRPGSTLTRCGRSLTPASATEQDVPVTAVEPTGRCKKCFPGSAR